MTSVIIPSRNSDNLRLCIQAIDQYDRTADIRLIVVDDGLAEKPPRWIRETECSVIKGRKPFVFARNINIGIRAAGNDDVILLNDDCLLTTKDGFAKLIAAGNEHPEFGIIAPACNNVGNTNQNYKGVGLRREPRMVCFTCVWIPRRTIEAVGVLDERFVNYGWEDNDMCLRITSAGLKIGIFDGCVMDHASLVSSFRGTHGELCSIEPGRRIFLDKWGSAANA